MVCYGIAEGEGKNWAKLFKGGTRALIREDRMAVPGGGNEIRVVWYNRQRGSIRCDYRVIG